jgi:hypothetical protein
VAVLVALFRQEQAVVKAQILYLARSLPQEVVEVGSLHRAVLVALEEEVKTQPHGALEPQVKVMTVEWILTILGLVLVVVALERKVVNPLVVLALAVLVVMVWLLQLQARQ